MTSSQNTIRMGQMGLLILLFLSSILVINGGAGKELQLFCSRNGDWRSSKMFMPLQFYGMLCMYIVNTF